MGFDLGEKMQFFFSYWVKLKWRSVDTACKNPLMHSVDNRANWTSFCMGEGC